MKYWQHLSRINLTDSPTFIVHYIGAIAVSLAIVVIALFNTWLKIEPQTMAYGPEMVISTKIITPPAEEPTIPQAPTPQKITVKQGDTLTDILIEHGLSAALSLNIADALSKKYDPKNLSVGQEILLTLDTEETNPTFVNLTLPVSRGISVHVDQDKGSLEVSKKVAPKEKRNVRIQATIQNSLFSAATKQGIAPTMLTNLTKAFSYDVDFQRDIQPGDQFEVLFERYYTPDGEVLKDGKVLFASLETGGKKHKIYHYTTRDNRSIFLSEDGHYVKKALLRTPMNVFRISSRFGKRRHPILGYNKMHKGVDFAAPTGTPIFAAGDGKITQLGWKGAYGKYVRIRHSNKLSTAYAHISRFARGMKRGKYVKQGQVIAYVGSTGRSTGPHLHYEVLSRGRQVDPLKVSTAPSVRLSKKERKRFKKHIARINTLIANTPLQGEETYALNAEKEPAIN